MGVFRPMMSDWTRFAPCTDEQRELLAEQAALSRHAEAAIRAKDLGLLVEILAEKKSIETALAESRGESWEQWREDMTGGAT